MFRKLVVRLLLGCLLLAGVVVTMLFVAGYLAMQQPSFYAELRDKPISPAEQAAAKQQMESTEFAFKQWLQRSIARQQAAPLTAAASTPSSAARNYERAADTYSVSMSQDLLNTAMASETMDLEEGVQLPRVQISRDGVEFACQFVTSQVTCVLSAVLKPTLTPDGELRIEVASARIGKLPIPLSTILRCLPHEVAYTGRDMDIDLTPPTPYITLHIYDRSSPTAMIESIECKEGEIVVEFLPPATAGEATEFAAL